MRIVFIGTVEFSKSALKKLIDINANVVGVCTKKTSRFNSDFADLTDVCLIDKIPIIYTNDINSPESLAWIKDKSPDVIFCFGWSSLIRPELLNLSPKGIVGFHPAELPKNRGRHPIVWALSLGLDRTASTFFFMDEGADSGDILSQKEVPIYADDYAHDLYLRITDTALIQLEEFVPQLQVGNYTTVRQNQEKSNIWRKRNMNDGRIDFRMCSKAIYDLVRALAKPYVGAHVTYEGGVVKVWRAEIVTDVRKNLEPGLVLSHESGLVVKTYDGAINLIDHEFKLIPSIGTYL